MMYDLINELANPFRELNREERGQLVEAMRVSSHGTVPSDVELAGDEELATRLPLTSEAMLCVLRQRSFLLKCAPSQVEACPI